MNEERRKREEARKARKEAYDLWEDGLSRQDYGWLVYGYIKLSILSFLLGGLTTLIICTLFAMLLDVVGVL